MGNPGTQAAAFSMMRVTNLLGHGYLLKGAFFSGAAVGRPRSVLLRLNIAS